MIFDLRSKIQISDLPHVKQNKIGCLTALHKSVKITSYMCPKIASPTVVSKVGIKPCALCALPSIIQDLIIVPFKVPRASVYTANYGNLSVEPKSNNLYTSPVLSLLLVKVEWLTHLTFYPRPQRASENRHKSANIFPYRNRVERG